MGNCGLSSIRPPRVYGVIISLMFWACSPSEETPVDMGGTEGQPEMSMAGTANGGSVVEALPDTAGMQTQPPNMAGTPSGGAMVTAVDCEAMPDAPGCIGCDELDACSLSQCADAAFCKPCNEGGSCFFTDALYVFGEARTSRGNDVLTDLTIRASCGARMIREAIVDNDGSYELNIDVADCCPDGFTTCDDLVIAFQRAPNVQGYVPLVHRFTMPPPVNTINLDAKLYGAEELRCDGVVCRAAPVFNGPDSGDFATGYVYNSRELNEISNFGAIFRDQHGALLWLHRFIYRDYRDSNSVTLDVLPTGRSGCLRLNDNTRSWVTDVTARQNGYDYHQQELSNYSEEEEWDEFAISIEGWAPPNPACEAILDCAERAECGGAPVCNHQLTDPNLDPDGDGQYDTIEMYTYRLDLVRGHWETYVEPSRTCSVERPCPDGSFCAYGRCLVGGPVGEESCTSAADCPRTEAAVAYCVGEAPSAQCYQAEPTYSDISAVIEPAYDNVNNQAQFATIGDELVVPVPSLYLEGVQTTGNYGPSYTTAELDQGRPERQGLYGNDYACIPNKGSGIFAIGYPMPRSCFLIKTTDDCGTPVFGSQIDISGVNHGFRAQQFTNAEGHACVEVARSEAFDRDFDGDGQKNERFEVELELSRPLNARRLREPAGQVRRTPTTEDASCATPELCEVVELSFQSCLPEDFIQPVP